MKWSLQEFGDAAARRYEALIQQALIDIATDPERPGSSQRPDMMVEGARTYHISLSRSRVSGLKVNEPHHFLFYRRRDDGVIEVARIPAPVSIRHRLLTRAARHLTSRDREEALRDQGTWTRSPRLRA